MNSLIKIQYENNEPVVSGRELHEFLGVKTEYRHWFPRMCEYSFVEGQDYTPVIFDHPQNKQKLTDHMLTISMAKEICMIQRNEKGKIARQYFLELEKSWNSPEQVMARALKLADQKILSLKTQNEEMKPKALFADAVTASADCILIRELAKYLKQNGVNTGEKRLYMWLREHKYLIKSGDDYNTPTQRAIDMGLFRIKKFAITKPDGETITRTTTTVTGKGQQYFLNKFLKELSEVSV